ncbi:uncharacterized protein RSE6_09200 [Rhynchosporium secalis]|uniref:Uncharacterized protein n=1 Tax=Rhynchosporium secalis TaxID=38038 RepID=A0A1E1MHD3_RHYSE|nr:uncharacterized protein RSE6_09200 [Rhynchosporium secalis]
MLRSFLQIGIQNNWKKITPPIFRAANLQDHIMLIILSIQKQSTQIVGSPTGIPKSPFEPARRSQETTTSESFLRFATPNPWTHITPPIFRATNLQDHMMPIILSNHAQYVVDTTTGLHRSPFYPKRRPQGPQETSRNTEAGSKAKTARMDSKKQTKPLNGSQSDNGNQQPSELSSARSGSQNEKRNPKIYEFRRYTDYRAISSPALASSEAQLPKGLSISKSLSNRRREHN